MTSRSTRLLLGLALALTLLGTPALAAPPANDSADEHDRRGKVLYGKGDLEGALAEFRAAFAALPRPAFLFNAARALERLGRTREAFDAYSDYLSRAEGAAEREAAAGILAGLCPDVGRGVLRVTSEPAGAQLAVDGTPFPVPSDTVLCLCPGAHALTASKEGFQPARHAVETRSGSSGELRLVLTRTPTNGTVRVTSEVVPATVRLDGTRVGEVPIDVPVPAGGRHELTVDAGDGWQPWRQTVQVREGHLVSVHAIPKPGSSAPAIAPAPGPVAPPVDEPDAPEASFNWGWVTLGTAVALAATGGVLYGLAYDRVATADGLDSTAPDYDARFDDLAVQVQRLQLGAFVTWGLAAAAGVATPFVWVSAPPAGPDATSSLSRGWVVTLRGTF